MSHRQTADSFWNRVDVQTLDKCWPFIGSVVGIGYGRVGWNGVTYFSHRIAAWLLGFIESPIAPLNRKDNGFVLHNCDNPICCNPTHLDINTQSKNNYDAYKRGRRKQLKGQDRTDSKLTNIQAMQIRKLSDMGKTQRYIAKQFGVCQRSICRIVNCEIYI